MKTLYILYKVFLCRSFFFTAHIILFEHPCVKKLLLETTLNNMKYIILAVIICIAQNASAQTIRLATYQYAENDRIKNITPLASYLEQKTGNTIEVKSYPDIPTFISAIQKGEVDLALISTFGYFLLDASSVKHAVRPRLTLNVNKEAINNYKTAIVCRKEMQLYKLEDVKSKANALRATFVAPGSTSGNLVPRLAYNGLGLSDVEKTFLSVGYSKTHMAALQLVLHDSTDIAAMGYTEYEKLLREDSASAKQLRLLWLSPEIPLGPVLFNDRLSAALQQKIVAAMLSVEKENKDALLAVKAGWSEAKQATSYITIDESFYNPFKSILGDKKALQSILNKFAN